MSAEKDDAFFADGIQDDLLASLGKIKDLKVIARSSVMIYRGVAVAGKLREIGQALRVSHVLQGSVRRGANRVVINVALIDTRNDNQVWSQHYDRTLNDMLSLQGELAVEIARELQATLTPNEKSTVETKPTKNSEAYVLYLKALDRDRRAASREDGIAADQLYTQAIALDPTFALAVARASIHNSRMYSVGGDPTRKAKARAQAEEALRLSPALGEAHLALALCFYRIDKNYEAALQELSKAAATSPNDPEILDFTGGIYLHQGHWREALANFLRAQELDPNNPYADKQDRDIAGTYVALRDWPAAAAALQRLRQIAPENEPDNVDAQVGLAYVEFFRTGNLAAGKEILHKIPAGLDPNAGVTMARWDFSMLERDFAAAEKILAEYPSEEFPPPMRTPKNYFQGLTALARGDAALAQTLFENARPSYELGVQNHPDDPRFLARIAMLYAYLGRKGEAIRASRRAVELVPQSKDAAEAPGFEESLAGVYACTGEADQAIALIEQLLTKPGGLILAELRLHWQWDPLRTNPRFKKILAGPEPKTIY
jgi:TolB-like protein/Tfp pilus assembly protein PilF